MFFTYILYSPSKDKYYIGECEDLGQRLIQHNSGFYKDAFTAQANDWDLYFSVISESREEARFLESYIKRMKSRKYIENLKLYPDIILKLKENYKQESQSR